MSRIETGRMRDAARLSNMIGPAEDYLAAHITSKIGCPQCGACAGETCAGGEIHLARRIANVRRG